MKDNTQKVVVLYDQVVDDNIRNKGYNIVTEPVERSRRGEIDMSEYVTKTEFDSTVKNLENQIAHNQEMTNVKIDSVLEKIDSSNALIIEKINGIEKNINTKFDGKINGLEKNIDTKFDHIEENVSDVDKKVNWIIGLAATSVLIPIALKYFGI